jgi:hypothetical protein
MLRVDALTFVAIAPNASSSHRMVTEGVGKEAGELWERRELTRREASPGPLAQKSSRRAWTTTVTAGR